MRMSADHERGKIADDVRVSDLQSVRTVSQRSIIKIQYHFRFSPPRTSYSFLHETTKGFRRKTVQKNLWETNYSLQSAVCSLQMSDTANALGFHPTFQSFLLG